MLTKELIESMSERVQSAYAEYCEKKATAAHFKWRALTQNFHLTEDNEDGMKSIFMEVHGTRFDDTVRRTSEPRCQRGNDAFG